MTAAKHLACPLCGQTIEAVEWKATIVRSNMSEDGIIGGAPFDTFYSVPPGTFWAMPCQHQLDEDTAREMMTLFAARARQQEEQGCG